MDYAMKNINNAKSLPSRGAWIEIDGRRGWPALPLASLPSRGAWIEIAEMTGTELYAEGRSPHGERG